MLIIALSTLKNYITARYNADHNRIKNDQKDLLKNSILDLYYEIKDNPNAVKLYKEIVYQVAAVDFPWHGIGEQLMQDLGNRIEAGVYFTRQVVKVYDYIEGY